MGNIEAHGCTDIGSKDVGVHIPCKKGDCHDDLHSGEGKTFI